MAWGFVFLGLAGLLIWFVIWLVFFDPKNGD